MYLVSEIPIPEENALEKLRLVFSRLLNRDVEMVTLPGEGAPNGLVLKEAGHYATPLLTIVYKRAFSEVGYDPSTQASFFVREFLASDQVHDPHVFLRVHLTQFLGHTILEEVLLPVASPRWRRCLLVHPWCRLHRQVHRSAINRQHVGWRGHHSGRYPDVSPRASL